MSSAQLRDLEAFLAIPSVSADPAGAPAVHAAAAWVLNRVRRAGGDGVIHDAGGMPIVDAVIPASLDASCAPTVLCYGHVDVQPPQPLGSWDSDPFAPVVRDGWVVARGVADDKGQLWCLLEAAAALSSQGSLPVNVRFCCDGEEEIGGSSVVAHLEHCHDDPVACVIFDTPMLDDVTPVFTIGTRGTLYMHVEVQTGQHDLHSGVYGGAALNALHVLTMALGRLFATEGRVADVLLGDVIPPPAEETRDWTSLPSGSTLLHAQGAAPADADAARDFYERTWALPSLDVNGIEGGSPVHPKTIVVSHARANLSMRLAPGQRVATSFALIEQELRRDLPEAATLELTVQSACEAGSIDPFAPAIVAARDAFERATGRRPMLLRTGGSLPLVPLLERLGIPAIVTGIATPDSNMHAPNERVRLDDLADGIAVAREMFVSLASLT